MMRVYVAGPYSKGDIAANVREAISVGDTLLHFGLAPYVPHLNHFWHLMHPNEYQDWLDLDLEFLAVCDVLIRLPGKSTGADLETATAISLGMPVFFTVHEVIAYAHEREGCRA